eukprot:161260-Chlamydomonas_euryale.AAC.2
MAGYFADASSIVTVVTARLPMLSCWKNRPRRFTPWDAHVWSVGVRCGGRGVRQRHACASRMTCNACASQPKHITCASQMTRNACATQPKHITCASQMTCNACATQTMLHTR